MRKFVLHRDEDVSGVSGTGDVAEGVMFFDGTAVMKWRTKMSSIEVFRDIGDVLAIHGHEGKTVLKWED